jgi:hypothetical protein
MSLKSDYQIHAKAVQSERRKATTDVPCWAAQCSSHGATQHANSHDL